MVLCYTERRAWHSLAFSRLAFGSEADIELTSLEIICFRRLFNHFDEDNDGHFTSSELKVLLVTLGIERHNGQVPDEEEVAHWMQEFDIIHKDGHIDKPEFLAGLKKWIRSSKVPNGSSSNSAVSSSNQQEFSKKLDSEAQVRIQKQNHRLLW